MTSGARSLTECPVVVIRADLLHCQERRQVAVQAQVERELRRQRHAVARAPIRNAVVEGCGGADCAAVSKDACDVSRCVRQCWVGHLQRCESLM